MRVNLSFARKTFDQANSQMFENTLPPIAFRLSRAGSYLGKFDIPEKELEDIIIHEMIHYFINFSGIKDTSPHGPRFREIMCRINRDFNRDISISVKLTEQKRKTDLRYRRNFIAVSHFSTGNIGITICSHRFIKMLHTRLPNFPGVERIEWFISINPWFNRFPMVRSLKIYTLSEEEYQTYLLDSKRKDTKRLENIQSIIK